MRPFWARKRNTTFQSWRRRASSNWLRVAVRHPVLANNIRRARDELSRQLGRRVSQQEVADAAGINVRVYQRHETGKIGMNVETLVWIAVGLQTTGEELMRGVFPTSTIADARPRADLDA